MSSVYGLWADMITSPTGFPVDSALEALQRYGAPVESDDFSQALGVALIHSSYLYEHARELPGVTRGVLDALARLGGAFLQRRMAIEAFGRVPGSKPGPLNTEIAHISSTLPAWATRQSWIGESTALGASLVGEPLPPRVVADLFRRVVGLLCILDLHVVATRLTSELAADIREAEAVRDPISALQVAAKAAPVTFAYSCEGPDHQAIFHAVATDARGRRTTGTGRSKKSAAHDAAREFLQRYYPAVTSGAAVTVQPAHAVREISGYRDHTRTVDRIQRAFVLRTTARPLLSQALIHSSWTYEHQAEATRAGQRSNQVLGLVGSHVLAYEHALAVAHRAVAERPDTLRLLTLPNDAYERAYQRADLASGHLVGAGQSAVGISTETAANVFQAVMAAVYLGKRRPPTLVTDWPPTWRPVWRMVAPDQARDLDDTSRLQRAANALRLDVTFEFELSGPGHRTWYIATAVVASELLADSVRVTGDGATGKTGAKHMVARRVLDMLHGAASGITDDAGRALTRLVLAQQASILASDNPPIAAWTASGRFGLDLVQCPDKLLDWASRIDQYLRGRSSAQLVAGLTDAFRQGRDLTDTRSQVIDAELRDILNAITAVHEPTELNQILADRVVRLCQLLRCMGTDEPDSDLTHLADEWSILHPDRLAFMGPVPAVTLTARERAVVDAAANSVLDHGDSATVTVVDEHPLRLRLTGPTKPGLAPACMLWSAVTWTAAIRPIEGGVEVEILKPTLPPNPGPVSLAAFAALRPEPNPLRRRVADVLHDVKNQASASRRAANAVAATPVGRYEQLADAHRHLERMQRLALSLTAATSAPNTTARRDVDLGPFLRQYARDLLTRLPDRVGLDAPATDTAARAAIDEGSLGLVLDNLTANAVEAIPGGGRLRLDWTVDEENAAIEVTDDGPGIAADIVTALDSGAQIRTTKQRGSGIGLLSVQSLLRRVGGRLSWIPSPTGTTWHIRLPLVAVEETNQ